MIKKFTILTFILFSSLLVTGQGRITGSVFTENDLASFAEVYIENTEMAVSTDASGAYIIADIPHGKYTITAAYIGYKSISKTITITQDPIQLDFNLNKKDLLLDEVVVTGTKTFKRKTNSPVIVNILSSKTLDNVQACNLSEGLKFQPGLRVETDCQTCNYTQLRMNGLTGGYSQILINGRPIFSPLTGLYGLEQLPVNMIDRIEVVRGGGSSLYGTSAIGGTVNVLTKIPKKNSYELNTNYQSINGTANDFQLLGNTTYINKNKNAGISLFINHRDRQWYDHNDDNYSELPALENTSIGSNVFILPTKNQKLELSINNLNEYRYGGEMVDKPAYQAQQSEERVHNVWMASADYQINFNNDRTSLITYAAWQNTKRKHYTGITPDDSTGYQQHTLLPPYGNSLVKTYNIGVQMNHKLNSFLGGSNVLTLGSEYIVDDVFDEIETYKYKIDQTTKDVGLFLQSDWEIGSSLSLLSGIRMDKHSLVDPIIFSPRLSLLYKHGAYTQVRLNYGTGFRAPQSFDTDLHIAFAGGGVSRVQLSPSLMPEHSTSYSGSINYDKPTDKYVYGFTLEGFYTRLNDAFFLQPIGEDEFGELFEKRNGQSATVAGGTLEARINYDRKIQVESGFTLQSSEYADPISYIEGLKPVKKFIRTPSNYGFATLTYTPSQRVNAVVNYIYTGSMIVPHFAGAPNQSIDEMIDTPHFHEISSKLSYTIPAKSMGTAVEIYGGIKNMFNAYQKHFDIGKNRDSNFVYGPAAPRTYYLGVKLRSM